MGGKAADLPISEDPECCGTGTLAIGCREPLKSGHDRVGF